jgi:hypothetical protein
MTKKYSIHYKYKTPWELTLKSPNVLYLKTEVVTIYKYTKNRPIRLYDLCECKSVRKNIDLAAINK